MSRAAALEIWCSVTLLSVLLAWAARQALTVEIRKQHHEVGAAVLQMLGVIFAVLLAFIFNEVWSEYNTAADAINRECSALRGAALIAEGLPPVAREQTDQAIAAYVDAVVTQEFPAMERRQASPEARERFRDLFVAAARLDDASGLRGQLVTLLTEAHAQRQTRLFQMSLALPPSVWAMLILLSAVLVVFVMFAGVEYTASRLMFTGLLAGTLCFALLIVRLLDYPYEGALKLPSTDFTATLQQVRSLPSR